MEDEPVVKSGGKEIHDLFREVFVLHGVLSHVMDMVHEQAGLSTSKHRIMRSLIRMGPATVPDVAAVLNVSRQFVQKTCNELYADGFIEFRDNPRHKRSKFVLLTKSGESAFAQARQKENAIIEQVMPDIDPDRAAEAREILKSIRKAIDENRSI